MVEIKEALPNPIGKDTDGEYIILQNTGEEVADLSNWKIKDASGKTFSLTGYKIEPLKDLILEYKTTKIALNNDGETLILQNDKNEEIDRLEITRSEEGVIFKKDDVSLEQKEEIGLPIRDDLDLLDIKNNLVISEGSSPYLFITYALTSALLLAAGAVYSMKKLNIFHEDDQIENE